MADRAHPKELARLSAATAASGATVVLRPVRDRIGFYSYIVLHRRRWLRRGSYKEFETCAQVIEYLNTLPRP